MRSMAVIILLLAVSCQPTPPSRTKIVGGAEVTDEKDITVRSTVSLLAAGALCTGTIIGPNQVVTAAHCIKGSDVTIGFGASKTPIPGVRVIGARAHPAWGDGKADQTHDIGMIIFEGQLPGHLGPVAISPLTGISNGAATILAGYGVTGESNSDSGTLRKVAATIKSFNGGSKEFDMQEGMGVGSCYGDSGGPAYIQSGGQLTVIGATSRGQNCDSGDGVYTDVRYYQGWLKCTAKEFGQPLGSLLNDSSNEACKPEYIDTVVTGVSSAQDIKIMIGAAGSVTGEFSLQLAANADAGNLRQVSFCVGDKATCQASSATWIQATKNTSVGGRALFTSPNAIPISDGLNLTVKSEAGTEINIEQFKFTKI